MLELAAGVGDSEKFLMGIPERTLTKLKPRVSARKHFAAVTRSITFQARSSDSLTAVDSETVGRIESGVYLKPHMLSIERYKTSKEFEG